MKKESKIKDKIVCISVTKPRLFSACFMLLWPPIILVLENNFLVK